MSHKRDLAMAKLCADARILDERQAMAAIILWNSGLFDTFEIGAVLNVGESAIVRTLQASRDVARERVS